MVGAGVLGLPYSMAQLGWYMIFQFGFNALFLRLSLHLYLLIFFIKKIAFFLLVSFKFSSLQIRNANPIRKINIIYILQNIEIHTQKS